MARRDNSKNNNNNITISIILLVVCVTVSHCSTPLYFIQSQSTVPYAEPTLLSLENLNLETNQTTQLSDISTSNFPDYGIIDTVIYYKTGVLYALYLIPSSSESILLSIDTNTGEIIDKSIKLCDNFVTLGLSIDQTNGEIHFLNRTSYNSVTSDWLKWNIEQNEITMIEESITSPTTGSMLYNSITETLWAFNSTASNIFIYQQNEETIVYNTTYNQVWNTPAINPTTGQIYAFNLNSQDGLEGLYSYIVTLDYNGTAVYSTNVCSLLKPFQYSIGWGGEAANSADFDYISNTYTFRLNDFSADKNEFAVAFIWYISLDTCEFNHYSVDAQYYSLSTPAFNSAESY